MLLMLFCMMSVSAFHEEISSSKWPATTCPNVTLSTPPTPTPTGHPFKQLYNYLTGIGAHRLDTTLTLGFLGAYGHTPVDLGALPLAVAFVNQEPDLLPGRTLHYLAADIGTSPNRRRSALAALAIRIMTQMRDNGTVAFIGPDDTCRSEALVAAAWNLPMIAYKCADTLVSDKRVYQTFARTLPPSSKVSKSVVALLKAFDWTKFVIVAGKRPAWGDQVLEGIKEVATAHDMQLTQIRRFSESDYVSTHRHIQEMENIVAETYQRTRVYVFVGEHIALVDFVHCLQRRRLLDQGRYVIISVDDAIYDPERRLDILQRSYLDPHLRGGGVDLQTMTAGFRSVLKFTSSHPRNPQYKEVCEKIKSHSRSPPFCVPYHHKIFDSISVPIEAAHLYDAVLIYARAATEVLRAGEDPRNGTAILARITNRAYKSIQGFEVFIDENGDAEGNYSVVTLLSDETVPTGMSMQPVGYFRYTNNATAGRLELPEFRYFDPNRPIQWVGGTQPVAEPPCGFLGERCEYKADWRLTVALPLAVSLALVASVFAFKHYRYEQKLACLLWKIDMRDVTLIPTDGGGGGRSVLHICPSARQHSAYTAAGPGEPKRAYTRIGLYKGSIVAIKHVHKRSLDLTRAIRKELKQMREIRHDNLLPFVGACVDTGMLAILTAYCARGSLEDVLANPDLRLDNMFVSSLVADMLKGLIHLHDSEIISHGNFRSSNCLVDSRWVLQISDFGLHEFKGYNTGFQVEKLLETNTINKLTETYLK